jgi:vancomycin resistance protein VanJ
MSDLGPRRYRIADYAVPPSPPPARWPIRRVIRTILLTSCGLYAASALGLWGAVSWSSPEFWPSHLFLYGPRWVVCLPALLLVPAVIWLRLRWSALALAVAVVAFVGIYGFNVPWTNLVPVGGESRPSLRLLTCNVQGQDLRTHDLAELIRETRPDVVFLQECSLDDPHAVLGQEGWYVRSDREFCLASRYPIVDFETLVRPDKDYRIVAVRATVSWSGRMIPIVAVHLMTPRRGLDAIISSPLRGLGTFREVAAVQRFESGLLRRWVEECPGSILLAGDFNLTVEHPLYRRDWSDYANAFSRVSWGRGRTMFTQRIGLRIDHILCGSGWRPRRCWVGPDVGSAHRPVIADLIGDALIAGRDAAASGAPRTRTSTLAAPAAQRGRNAKRSDKLGS